MDDDVMNKIKDITKRQSFLKNVVGIVLRDFKFNQDENINKENNIEIENTPNIPNLEMSIRFSNDKFSLLWAISCKTDPIIVRIENYESLIKNYDLSNSIEVVENLSKEEIKKIIMNDIYEAYKNLFN